MPSVALMPGGVVMLPLDMKLIEPVPIDDCLCTELVMIEDLGFGARFVVANRQTCYEAGTPIAVVKQKIVLPYASIQPAVVMTVDFLGRRMGRAAGRSLGLVV